MNIETQFYEEQKRLWPKSGRHILAHYDHETIVVYQAYNPDIGNFAVRHGYFGGSFSFQRMSWIKPNFLWMMYRCDWGRSQNQEMVLGIRLRRTFFDSLLEIAVPSSFNRDLYEDEAQWRKAIGRSEVRLQWDPDHSPSGDKCERRAIQLGMRGRTLESYGKQEIIEVIDMTPFLTEQRDLVTKAQLDRLKMPSENVYIPASQTAITNVRLEDS